MRLSGAHFPTRGRDTLALLMAMTVAILLALNFDLFREADHLTAEEVEITALEAIALLMLLVVGLVKCGAGAWPLPWKRSDKKSSTNFGLSLRKIRSRDWQIGERSHQCFSRLPAKDEISVCFCST